MNRLSRVVIKIFVLIAVTISTNIVPVRAATTWIVTNLSDSGLGSLRYAIENSSSGDTITFDPILSGQTILTAGIIINHNLTIDGSSLDEHVIISGGNSNRVFGILNCTNFSCTHITVSIKSVDITNGGFGGLLSLSSTTTIDDVNFHNNQNSNSWGGAIRNDGNMAITNSRFTNNSGEKGGAIFNTGILTITNSTIANNTSEDWGGGIYNENIITISNSSIYSNYAELSGDGIYTRMGTNVANTIITQSAIYNNLGQGVFFEGSYTTGDTEDKLTIINSTITGNSGKGVMTSYGSLIVKNSTIANNTQPIGWGGGSGIHVFGDAPNLIGTITLINSIVANNTNGNDCDLENSEVLESAGNLIENNGVGDNSCGNPTVILDPMLGLLQNNGGSTPTMALLPNSPAINSGNNTLCDSTDQRGLYRPQGGICDIGAYELDFQPIVSSIVRASTSPTSATSIDFNITFSESVQNVDVNDFSLTTTGVSGASITGVTPVSASVYTISVNTGSRNGTIRLDVPDTASIKDLSNNDLSGLPFTSGEVYTIDKSTPLPVGWVGSVSVTSDKALVSVGRPHIGSEVASYDGFSSGSTTAFVPMLFKDAFGGDYDAALYIQNVSGSSASVTLEFYDTSGSLNCTKSDSIAPLASKGYWLPSVSCTSGSLPAGWVGGVKVSSDQPIVAVGRPHIGAEVMTYNGFSAGSSASFVPMLFKDAFGGSYDSAFYIQNVGTSSASVTIQYFDNSGSLHCTKSDSIASFASKGYWLPSATCDSGSLPTGWVGGVKVSSDQPIVTVGRPHIGSQITTYDGFSAGSSASFVPMLFKDAFGGSYDSAFYLQNTGASSASVTIEYYDNAGSLQCTKSDSIAPLASKGYWLPAATCDTGSLPAGWVGGVKVSSDQPVVAVGRPHIGSQITTYNGFPSGAVSAFLPMLFKDAFGGEYDSAFYLQNTEATEAAVTIQFFDNTGTLTCSRTDTIQPRATLGFWVPSTTCFP